MTDAEADDLERRLRAGDDAALGELFERSRDRLRRTVRTRLDERLRGRVDDDDVLQETFLAARDRLEHFRSRSELSFFVWARLLVVQTLVDVARRHVVAQKRRSVGELSLDDPGAGTAAPLRHRVRSAQTSPSRVAQRSELADRLAAAIARLPDRDREVLTLRHFEELTNDEVAQVLGLQKSAATNRYTRALRRLDDVLSTMPDLQPTRRGKVAEGGVEGA